MQDAELLHVLITGMGMRRCPLLLAPFNFHWSLKRIAETAPQHRASLQLPWGHASCAAVRAVRCGGTSRVAAPEGLRPLTGAAKPRGFSIGRRPNSTSRARTGSSTTRCRPCERRHREAGNHSEYHCGTRPESK